MYVPTVAHFQFLSNLLHPSLYTTALPSPASAPGHGALGDSSEVSSSEASTSAAGKEGLVLATISKSYLSSPDLSSSKPHKQLSSCLSSERLYTYIRSGSNSPQSSFQKFEENVKHERRATFVISKDDSCRTGTFDACIFLETGLYAYAPVGCSSSSFSISFL